MKITLSTKMTFSPFLLMLLLCKTKLYEKKNIFIYKFEIKFYILLNIFYKIISNLFYI